MKVRALAADERRATALLIAHLAELDTRDVLLREGYASLFAYCRAVLGFSEHGALNRIEVARAARRFPAILEMLASAKVTLTAVRLLAPHLTADNFDRILVEARGKRTEEIRAMAGGLSVMRGTSAPVRPTAVPASAPDAGTAASKQQSPGQSASGQQAAAPVVAGAGGPTAVDPGDGAGAPDRPAPSPPRRPVTLIGPTLEKLRLAKDLLRHAVPSGDENEIVDRALTLLVADLARRKFAGTDRPRASRGSNLGSRDVPAEVKRVVWLRDLGCCAYVGPNGHRCEERGFLEFHHVKPFEVGGEATVENIQLRCGRHNRYEAKVYFARDESSGDAVVREGGAPYGSATQGVTPGMMAPAMAAHSF